MGIAAEPEYQRPSAGSAGSRSSSSAIASASRARGRRSQALPGARLAGNYLDGVGLNDAVRTARAAVRSLLPPGPETP
jgi:hypothetical protein